MDRKLISIIIPVYNEEVNIPLVYEALAHTANGANYTFEYIYVDDGSTDGSVAAIKALAEKDSAVECVEFSRNFGKEMATTAGLHAAKGDVVIMVDADLQHPPQLIPQMVAEWLGGAEVVIGIRTSNNGEGLGKRWGSILFYHIMRLISETDFERGETDFRLLDRAVVDAYKNLPEHERMTRSLINWLGFRRAYVYFEAPARLHGNAQYSMPKLFRLALRSFVANSLLPLRLAGYLGVIITVGSLALGTAVFINRYVFYDTLGWHVSGPAQLAILLVFLVGIMLMALGIIALYIAKIHVEVAQRPLYIVRKKTPRI